MQWTTRRVVAALAGTLATALLVGLPTDVVPNPVFGRAVPVTWWSYPVLAVVSVLSGVLLATYVRAEAGQPLTLDAGERAQRRGAASGLLAFFAVGCPVCNKLVLLTLGASGAMTWFAPFQPLLATLSIAGLAWALRTRWRGAATCPVTERPAALVGPTRNEAPGP